MIRDKKSKSSGHFFHCLTLTMKSLWRFFVTEETAHPVTALYRRRIEPSAVRWHNDVIIFSMAANQHLARLVSACKTLCVQVLHYHAPHTMMVAVTAASVGVLSTEFSCLLVMALMQWGWFPKSSFKSTCHSGIHLRKQPVVWLLSLQQGAVSAGTNHCTLEMPYNKFMNTSLCMCVRMWVRIILKTDLQQIW